MQPWLNRCLFAASLWLLLHQAFAQADAGIAIAGLISIQPVNDTWLGNPYLDVGLGGLGR